MEFVKFFEKWIKPFIAIAILLMLILVGSLLLKEQDLKERINENCGWGEEDYYCYCEKSDVIAIENKIKGIVPRVKLDR